jgi:hypothetical protein
MDVAVPAVIGAVILVAVDLVRGESAPWWLVLLIFVVVFALYDGLRYLRRRAR